MKIKWMCLLGSLMIFLTVGGIVEGKTFAKENFETKNYKLSFNLDATSTVTSQMIKHKLERDYHLSNHTLSCTKKINPIKRPGTYKIQLTQKGLFFQKRVLPVTIICADKTGPKLQQIKSQIDYDQKINPSTLFKANDKVDGMEPTQAVQVTGLDTHSLGVEKVHVSATDHAGNKTKQIFKVTVIDSQKPEIRNITDCTLTVDQAATFHSKDGVKGIDNVDGDITNNIQVSRDTVPDVPGNYQVTYQLSDHSGNSTSMSRSITVTQNIEKGNSDADVQKSDLDVSNQKPVPDAPQSNETVEKTTTTEEKQSNPAPEQQATSTVSFLGVTIPFIHDNGASSAPASGCGTWTGTGAVDDNCPTHFIGHNPGDFSPVMNLTMGSQITVVDDQGHSKTYTVYEVLNVNDDGTNADNPADNTWSRVIDAGGERISLQTCITDTVNRIVLAR